MFTIVYVLTNPAMPGIVKIGKTTRDNPQVRMNELYTTGVPLPFECAIAINTEDEQASNLEIALHTAFGPYRLNPSREFFEIEPYLESTEGGRRVSVLKRQEGAPVLLG